MLKIVEPVDLPESPRRSSGVSFVCSLCFHGVLALILWLIAYDAMRRGSVSLTAAASTGPGEVTFEVADKIRPQEPVATDSLKPAMLSSAEIETLISQSLDSNFRSETVEADMEPPSVDFFGTRAYGNRFVFVLDISYSMKARDGERFRRACDELVRAVSALRPGQSYYVFVFCWSTEEMFYNPEVQYMAVADGHVNALAKWIYQVSLGAGTDPRRALSLAHQMNPDAVFLLSDGHFNKPSTPRTDSGWIDADGQPFKANVQAGVERMFRDTPIHTIAFENPFTLEAMQQIAAVTGGRCKYVKTRSLQPVNSKRFRLVLQDINQKLLQGLLPQQEFLTRLSYAREFIGDGELVYAEYLVRPLRHADQSLIANPVMLTQVFSVLDSELGSIRLENFEPPPELQ